MLVKMLQCDVCGTEVVLDDATGDWFFPDCGETLNDLEREEDAEGRIAFCPDCKHTTVYCDQHGVYTGIVCPECYPNYEDVTEDALN